MYKYIAKKDTWFKEGTICELLEDYSVENGPSMGLFRGIYIIENTDYDTFWHNQGYKAGDEVVMNEVCDFNKFKLNENEKQSRLQ